jgi:hypothetical protein
MEEFEMYFESIKSQFVELEKKYKYAVKHKKKDAKYLGIQFEKTMIYYKAAMNVKFDLEEWKKEQEAEMEVEVPEKETLEIKTTMEYMVQKKDAVQIKATLVKTYDSYKKAEIEHEKEPESEEKTEKYQKTKAVYKLNKKFYSEAVNPPEDEENEEEIIASVTTGSLAGGVSPFKEIDDEKKTLFAGWKSLIMTWLNGKGFNYKFTEFTPVSYRQQVVAGMNYTIIIRFSLTVVFEFKIYQKLDGNVSITDAEEKPAGYTGLPKKEVKVATAWTRKYRPVTTVLRKKFTTEFWRTSFM